MNSARILRLTGISLIFIAALIPVLSSKFQWVQWAAMFVGELGVFLISLSRKKSGSEQGNEGGSRRIPTFGLILGLVTLLSFFWILIAGSLDHYELIDVLISSVLVIFMPLYLSYFFFIRGKNIRIFH